MNGKKICYAAPAGEFENSVTEAILRSSVATKLEKKAGDPKFIENARIIAGFLVMLAGLYFGLFTTGAGEGLGFVAVMASPFLMIADGGKN